ncbi:hypothetical protein Kpol_1055p82 [Vanderwaltozyma polyspora DSM 70294]|uniref:Protein ECM19 n=1 Tax=Vanderwaltozyma polyspora (strain ATCC 22028 / DSM 70294 / BCRC 21397 / CBS 2163 / NBRC 10782 / NRRL Y-8283 / UCD 57-17) TaxID=436907 RepID=A7TGF5_VANPO|nr:uncharacterized protein Kpol_1055p82 [Vanderwaltozyma polyspora DSM 70294]EDO18725.1 hypothetical protein Kpol_1055p82 [Vanderwaltozyma polyspora DSM 70294]
MSRFNMLNLSAVGVAIVAGIYGGTKFFEPIVIEQLSKDGNLRKDIEIPKYDNEGNPIEPKSVLNLRKEFENIQKEQSLQRGLQEQQPTIEKDSSIFDSSIDK